MKKMLTALILIFSMPTLAAVTTGTVVELTVCQYVQGASINESKRIIIFKLDNGLSIFDIPNGDAERNLRFSLEQKRPLEINYTASNAFNHCGVALDGRSYFDENNYIKIKQPTF